MEAYKEEFIEFMVESDVLKFGEFTLKSGRQSPFFMNAGAYVTGDQLHRLGIYYAQAIEQNFDRRTRAFRFPWSLLWRSMSSTAKRCVIVRTARK